MWELHPNRNADWRHLTHYIYHQTTGPLGVSGLAGQTRGTAQADPSESETDGRGPLLMMDVEETREQYEAMAISTDEMDPLRYERDRRLRMRDRRGRHRSEGASSRPD